MAKSVSELNKFSNNPFFPYYERFYSTGFQVLDEKLGGGLFSGLYILTGLSSIGKTTFALQLASNFCKNNSNVLFCNLLIDAGELTTKLVSRFSYMICEQEKYDFNYAKTEMDVFQGKFLNSENDENKKIEKEIYDKAVNYAENQNGFYYLWNYPAIEMITIEEFENNIAFFVQANRKSVIIIDPIQYIHPISFNMSEDKNMESIIFNLKRISRKYHIPIIAISSVKINNNSHYLVDGWFDMQLEGQYKKSFNIEENMYRNPRKIVLKILKNKKGGGFFKEIKFLYHTPYNYFEEMV